MDLAVKWRYFRHLHGGNDPDAERVYLWHIEARRQANAKQNIGMDQGKFNPDDYLQAAEQLFHSMYENGFDREHAIPVDPDGELLGGAHRLACALVLDEDVWIEHHQNKVWAPSWGAMWFYQNNCPPDDIKVILHDYADILSGVSLCRSPKVCPSTN